MHIYVLGATGRNGLIVVKEALNRGHSVTALVRNPSSLAPHPNLTVVQGSPTNADDHAKALSIQFPSSIILTLANRRNVDRNAPLDILATSMTALLAALSRFPNAPRPKLVVNSLQGAHDSFTSLPWVFSALFQHSSMHYVINDHEQLDDLVRGSKLPFVMARPCRLVDGPAKEVKEFPSSGKGIAWMPTITRQSCVEWLLDAAERPDWDGQSPVLSN